MGINLDCVGRTYSAPPQVVDRARHRAYARAVGATPGSDGDFPRPLACFAAVYLLWPVVPQLFEDREVGLELRQLLHGEQEFRFSRRVSFGEEVTPAGEITRAERRRGMVFLEFQVQGTVAAAVVASSRSLFLVRESE